MQDELLTISQAAEYLKISEKTIRRLINSCKISASKVGNRSWRIRSNDLEAYLQANKNYTQGECINNGK